MSKITIKKGLVSLDIDDIMRAREDVDFQHDFYWNKRKMKKFSANHIFDEEKSVRWNKEEVIRRNLKIEEDIKKASDDYSKAENEFFDMVMENAMLNYGFTRPMVEKVWGKAYEDSHSSGYRSVVVSFENYLDFIHEMFLMAEED